MSILVEVSNSFYDICAFLARGVQHTTNGINFITQVNYNLVATVCTGAYSLASEVAAIALQVWNVVQSTVGCLFDFVHEFRGFISSVVCFVWKGCVGAYNFIDSSCVKVANLFTSFAHLVSQTYMATTQAVTSIYEGTSFICHLVVDTTTTSVTSLIYFLTSLGNGCINFVTGVWQGLGFVLSSVAYFPIYCVECVESAKQRLTNFVIHAVTFTPKETYLGIICLCLLYFMLSNTFRYFSCRGLPIISRMRRTRRRGQTFDWHFDRGFESDYEDLYNSDTEERRVWRNNWNVDSDESDRDEDSEGEDDGDDSDDSGTMDNDVSDDDGDEDSEDNYTVVTEESDSDGSLNSQTFSTESSDHEIEVQLPTPDERYNLRTRSSTPSRLPKPMSNPEDFDREMEKERDKRKCVVCQDQIKSVLVMPCRHMCLCVDCADHIVRSTFVGRRVCPLCRTRIQKVMNVYV